MNRILTSNICDELTRLSNQATPMGVTVGGIVHAQMAQDFGRYSAALDGDTSGEARARHADAMSYITSHGYTITASPEHLLRLAEILMPGTDLTEGVLTEVLDRLPPKDAHPFELSICLLAQLSLTPIPGSAALARAACSIPLRAKGLAPLLFVGVERHFPGLTEYAGTGDPTRLVQAFRIAYGASCLRYRSYFHGY